MWACKLPRTLGSLSVVYSPFFSQRLIGPTSTECGMSCCELLIVETWEPIAFLLRYGWAPPPDHLQRDNHTQNDEGGPPSGSGPYDNP